MAYPWTAHDILTAADLNAAIAKGIPKIVVKTADESVTSSTTLQDDNELLISLASGSSYLIEAHLLVSGAAAGDVKTAWARTGTLNQIGGRMVRGPGINTTDVTAGAAAATTVGINRSSGGNALTTALASGVDGTAISYISEVFTLTSVVTGTLTLQWAQNTSSATATIMRAGSFLIVTPITS